MKEKKTYLAPLHKRAESMQTPLLQENWCSVQRRVLDVSSSDGAVPLVVVVPLPSFPFPHNSGASSSDNGQSRIPLQSQERAMHRETKLESAFDLHS